ncbi:MAG TPA: MBL fold metallo-hydrolase [Bacteroidota bacterium]|nr:MBL fold metallo-hydrolase [Bacteroidota bacterium]
MNLTFWGVRGSIPTSGPSFVRYGGNTPCVEVNADDGTILIFDAGTGIRALGEHLAAQKKPVTASILITHPHWDHIQGFPFFKPAFVPGNAITIVGPERSDITLQRIIADQMTYIYFPVQLHELKATIAFRPVKEEEFMIGDVRIRSMYVNHPGFTLGYRIECRGKSLVYISDNEAFSLEMMTHATNFEPAVLERFKATKGDCNQRIFDFARDADVLIHDATYTPQEYADKITWGHSHYEFTLDVARKANVKRLFLFHHEPSRSDDAVDQIVKHCAGIIARNGDTFVCEAAREGAGHEW